MASKKYLEQRMQAEREKQFAAKKNRLRLFPLASLVVVVILLLLMLTHWVAIYNTSLAGNEVEVSGFNCVAAGLSGDYKSADEGTYGNMAVFEYHASAYIQKVSVITVVTMFVVIVHLLVQVFAVITNKQKAFNILALVFAAAEAALFITCYALALSVKDSGILTTYCNNNPACSIQSQAILPAVFAILSLASPILAMISERKLEAQFAPAPEKGKQEIKPALPEKGKGGKRR